MNWLSFVFGVVAGAVARVLGLLALVAAELRRLDKVMLDE